MTYSAWDIVEFISLGLAIVGFLLILLSRIFAIKNDDRLIKAGGILFSQCIIIGFISLITCTSNQNDGRKELIALLKKKDLMITVNGISPDSTKKKKF